MSQQLHTKGFTLVEMAVVLIIIGLLAGGVMTGLKVLDNAKVAATAQQVQNFSAATRTFKKTYRGMPGDLVDAHKKIRGCQAGGGLAGCQLVSSGGAVTEYNCLSGNHGMIGEPYSDMCAACGADPTGYPCDYAYSSGFPCSGGCTQMVCEFVLGGVYTTNWCDVPGVHSVGSITEIYDVSITQAAVTGMMGDGAVGAVRWDMASFRGEPVGTLNNGNSVDAETLLFWYQLKQAGLITGVTDRGIRGGDALAAKFGETHPAAKMGGGFWVGHNDGGDEQLLGRLGRPAGEYYDLIGNVLSIVKIPVGGKSKDITLCLDPPLCTQSKDVYGVDDGADDNALTPQQAADIDRKLDDGYPDSGNIHSFGTEASCYMAAPDGAGRIYDESRSRKDCGLFIKIK